MGQIQAPAVEISTEGDVQTIVLRVSRTGSGWTDISRLDLQHNKIQVGDGTCLEIHTRRTTIFEALIRAWSRFKRERGMKER